MKYNRGLMMAVLNDRIRIAKAVNATVITLDQAPQGYADFDRGVAKNSSSIHTGCLGPQPEHAGRSRPTAGFRSRLGAPRTAPPGRRLRDSPLRFLSSLFVRLVRWTPSAALSHHTFEATFGAPTSFFASPNGRPFRTG
jgi:hypothetical protein